MKNDLNRLVWGLLTFCIMLEANCEKMHFSIYRTWDDKETGHDPIDITLSSQAENIIMEIFAPFFDDPPAPNGEKGKPFHKLWDYEVVEAFFLGIDEKYLEVEFSPHGQHLLLLLSGRKNAIKMCLPVDYAASIEQKKWKGLAKIPKSYFPEKVTFFNAYAIHGSGENRLYEALYPVPPNKFDYPDFHRLEFFRRVNFSKLLLSSNHLSKIWQDALEKSREELVCEEE